MRLQPGLVMPGGIVPAARGPGGPTEADFEAHITSLGSPVSWLASDWGGEGAFVTTVGAPDGSMTGTSWLGVFWSGSNPSRVVQHGLPSEAVLTALAARGAKVLFVSVSNTAANSIDGLNRNGYNAPGYWGEDNIALRRCTQLLYWDNGPKQMNPFAGTGPTDYAL